MVRKTHPTQPTFVTEGSGRPTFSKRKTRNPKLNAHRPLSRLDTPLALRLLQLFLEPGDGLPVLALLFLMVGDVLDGQEDHVGVLARGREAAGVQQHGLRADTGKIVLHLKVFEEGILRNDFLQKFLEPGNIPLAVPQLVKIRLPSVSFWEV